MLRSLRHASPAPPPVTRLDKEADESAAALADVGRRIDRAAVGVLIQDQHLETTNERVQGLLRDLLNETAHRRTGVDA